MIATIKIGIFFCTGVIFILMALMVIKTYKDSFSQNPEGQMIQDILFSALHGPWSVPVILAAILLVLGTSLIATGILGAAVFVYLTVFG